MKTKDSSARSTHKINKDFIKGSRAWFHGNQTTAEQSYAYSSFSSLLISNYFFFQCPTRNHRPDCILPHKQSARSPHPSSSRKMAPSLLACSLFQRDPQGLHREKRRSSVQTLTLNNLVDESSTVLQYPIPHAPLPSTSTPQTGREH